MTDRVVFWDERVNYNHVKNVPRLGRWLGAHGIRTVKAEQLASWMKAFLGDDVDAYGSMVCMCMGITPASIIEEIDGNPLWYHYLMAGGRMVYVGDMTFWNVESATALPFEGYDIGRSTDPLGMRFGWSSPYWGQAELKVRLTAQGKKWGFETTDGSLLGFDISSVTVAFSTFDVPAIPGRPGTVNWMKNLRAEMPWSGLIRLCKEFDGNNDAQLRDVWRAIHYVGKPVAVPPLPPVATVQKRPLEIALTASGLRGREELARGETATVDVILNQSPKATAVVLTLLRAGRAVRSWEAGVTTGKGRTATFTVQTRPFAYGTYLWRATTKGADKPVTVEVQTGIRHVPSPSFSWGAGVPASVSRTRRDTIARAVAGVGMEPLLADQAVAEMDAVLRTNNSFSIRMSANKTDPDVPDKSSYYRFDSDHKPMAFEGYSGGRPVTGISHPDILKRSREEIVKWYRAIARHPALRPRICCNDDFSGLAGWDFAPHVRAKFRKLTGLDAPGPFADAHGLFGSRKGLKPPPEGIVPDNEPWLRWCFFSLEHVTGPFNRMQTEAVTSVRADTKIGPIPGGMQIPLVQMWRASQYPPLDFGPKGFNLGYFYYYNCYWQPVLTNTWWVEVTRLGNRDLDVWVMADCMGYQLYHRNNLFHLLAGGVKGMPYFRWGAMQTGAWREIQRQAPVIRKIGPVQGLLKPAQRKIGLMLPITADCYQPGASLVLPYIYANLMQGHFDVDPIAEEEIVSGHANRYEAVVVYNARWLRKSVADALARYAARGGKLILDPTVPFDIPGATRLRVDVGMGNPCPARKAGKQTRLPMPGRRDYSCPKRIRAIADELGKHVAPLYESPDVTLVANTFRVDRVPYMWFVNVHSGEEYRFLQPFTLTKQAYQKLRPWMDEVARSRFTAPVRMKKLPGVPYDLVAGKRLAVRQRGDRAEFWVAMDRLGGTLVAFYPEPIEKVAVAAPPTVKPLQDVVIRVTVSGKGGPVPGAVPIEIHLIDPGGRVHVTSGHFATRDGVYTFPWTPAVNDPPGRWTVKVKDLAGGHVAQAPVVLAP